MSRKKFNFAKKSAIALAVSAVIVGAEAIEADLSKAAVENTANHNEVLKLDAAAGLVLEGNLDQQNLLAQHSSHSSHASHGSHGSHSSHSSGY